MFVILQKYDFSSKSQRRSLRYAACHGCLWYCKSTIFQANHNKFKSVDVNNSMFVILQKYDFSSKSQPDIQRTYSYIRCLWYCKSTIFQANHNWKSWRVQCVADVCDTAKVRFFKQITTALMWAALQQLMFVILQKYDFSSKSQRQVGNYLAQGRCLWYCKSTIFQANHNSRYALINFARDVCDTAKVRFFKQITTYSRLQSIFL